MPRKKQETGSSAFAFITNTPSDITSSVSMAVKLGALTTMLQSSAIQDAYMDCHVTRVNGQNAVRIAISFAIPGDLGSFLSALWALNLPVTSPDTLQKK